jgi:hypothetical protein
MKEFFVCVGMYGTFGIIIASYCFSYWCGRCRGRNEMFNAQVAVPYPNWYLKWAIDNKKDKSQ